MNAGTHGTPDAIDLRAAYPPLSIRPTPMPIEYRRVTDGRDAPWLPTGYAGRVSYDVDRAVGEDTDGYRFHPYKVTDLAPTTR